MPDPIPSGDEFAAFTEASYTPGVFPAPPRDARAEALEEAARVAENTIPTGMAWDDAERASRQIAAAIRALI